MIESLGTEVTYELNICERRHIVVPESLNNLINLIFSIITLIVMIICFFSLVSTMGGNIL